MAIPPMWHQASPFKVAQRFLKGGLIQPPPAMLKSIQEWVLGCIAATKADKLGRKLESNLEARARYHEQLSALEQAASHLEGLLPNSGVRELASAAKNLFSLTLGIFGYGVLQEPKSTSFQKLDATKRAALVSTLQAMVGKVRHRCAVERLDRWADDDLEREISNLQSKVTSDAVSVRGGKAKKTFPVDLTGWKYGDAAIWDALKATQSKFLTEVQTTRTDLLDRLREAQAERKYGWREITVILMDGEMAPPNTSAGHWSPTEKELVLYIPLVQAEERILGTLYHELTHMAQAILRESVTDIDFADFYSETRKHVPGMPPKSISTPKYVQDREINSPKALENHAMDDVEFFTVLKNAIDTAKDGLRDLDQDQVRSRHRPATHKERRIYIDWFVGALSQWPTVDMGRIPPQQSVAFKTWRRLAPGKWKRGVKELTRALDQHT